MQYKRNSVLRKSERFEKKFYYQCTVEIYHFFRGWALIVISLVFSSIYKFGNSRIYSSQNGLAVITSVSTTGREFSETHLYTIYIFGSGSPNDISELFQGSMEYQRIKRFQLNVDAILKRDGSKNGLSSDCLITDG